MIRVLTALLILLACGGCLHITSETEKKDLTYWRETALSRNLSGESAILLAAIAEKMRSGASEQHDLPDLAAFIREAAPGKGDELSRARVWENTIHCVARFSDDPEELVRSFCAGELRCRAAAVLAEKQFLDWTVWRSAEQELRRDELYGELYQLFGNAAESELNSVALANPGDEKRFPPLEFKLPGEDPAAVLQIAGIISRLPGEIPRLTAADDQITAEGLNAEISYLAANCGMLVSSRRLQEAVKTYEKDPSPENLWKYRQWYYRMEADFSRLPSRRGSRQEQEFINGMLLLQETF